MTIDASDITRITATVTKEWTKQRKAEERGSRSRSDREHLYSGRVSFNDVAYDILTNGYDHASGDGKYSVSKRQLYYAVREQFKEATGRALSYEYFSNTVLVQFMNYHTVTKPWRVTADPRGTLNIPNAAEEVRIPCGTLQIDEHLDQVEAGIDPLDIASKLDIQWPSLAGGQRYQAVLYIEKEGFEPLMQEARIAELFDLAILSCKGQSVVAARRYIDEVCRVDGGVPLLVVHDFDKAGFEISQRLTTVSDWAKLNDRVTYEFENEINVTDLGLRLEDVQAYGLADEECRFKGYFASDSICTPEEKEFLKSDRRVELNAFTSPQFIEWLQAKLTEQGLAERLLPNDATLQDAYRRAMLVCRVNKTIEETVDEAVREAKQAAVPKSLRRQMRNAMEQSTDSWDEVMYDLVKSKLYPQEDN